MIVPLTFWKRSERLSLTREIRNSALAQVAGAVAQHHRAARRERRPDDLAADAFGLRLARLRVDDFDDAKVGIQVKTGR